MSSLRGKDYLEKFNCQEYLQAFFSPASESELIDVAKFHLRHLHDFYKTYGASWDLDTARLLEFGGGPVISGLISPAPYVREIVFAAYTENERKTVKLWKEQQDGAHDWSKHTRYIVKSLERTEGDAAWKKREALIRSRMSRIIACDITRDYPLEAKEEPFTIISTSLCLEAASESYTDYKNNVRKLVQLLKPGGFMTMFVVERESFYVVGQDTWYCLELSIAQVHEALEEAGMRVVVSEYLPASTEEIENPVFSDYKGVMFVVAQRV